jgi:heat shock 70kDa protein 1/2/6/8
MPRPIGIDLGTVYSCVGVVKDGVVEIIANSHGHRVTPSIVAFTDHKRLVGDAAKDQMVQNYENTVYGEFCMKYLFKTHFSKLILPSILGVKRLIGRRYADISQDDIKKLPFKVINQDGSPSVEVSIRNEQKIFSPEQISAAVLSKMKETAEEYLNDVVTEAVITVPAYFNDSQRQATKDAAEIAGLNVLRLLNEPTAAAIAYGLKEKVSSDQNILVFDMGGGTFDVSILKINGEIYEVKAVGGDTRLGGEDFNNKILGHFLKEIEQKYKMDLPSDNYAIRCEDAKIALSTAEVVDVRLSSDFKSSITRACFEDLNADFFKKAIKIVEDTIVQANLSKTDIHEVILVGGSTYIPKVQEMLQECFKGKALNRKIKPDEAVAYGAAVLASILSDDSDEVFDLLLLDVTPHSLGVEHGGGRFHKIINRNTLIPFEVSSTRFSVPKDNQTIVPINIYKGENELAIKNNLLGRFHLSGLTKAKAGEVKITVNFKIDEDGILKVTASESKSSVMNSLKVDVFKNGAGQRYEKDVSQVEVEEAMAKIRLFKFVQSCGNVGEREYPE